MRLIDADALKGIFSAIEETQQDAYAIGFKTVQYLIDNAPTQLNQTDTLIIAHTQKGKTNEID